MKKTALLFSGIIAATILVIMGLGILLTGSFYFISSITINPFSDKDIDGNGILVLTGTTNLGVNTFLLLNVSAGPGQTLPSAAAHSTELVSVQPGSGGRNVWKAAVNVSSLPPGDYIIRVSGVTFAGNNRTAIPGAVMVTGQFRLGNESAGENRGLASPFIIANTPGNKAVSNTIGINGTTNLPPGTSVLWNVYKAQCPGNSTNTTFSDTAALITGSTAVTPGTSGNNRWELEFNSSGMASGCYRVRFAGETPEGIFSEGMADFALSGEGAEETRGPSVFITIDTIPDQQVNTQVVITGTTSIPAGEEFIVEISPLAGSGYDFSVNPKDMSRGAMFAGVAGTALVEPWTGDIGLWSMDFGTYYLPPGEYEVTVSNSRVNQTTFRTEPGNVSITGTFTVRGGNS